MRLAPIAMLWVLLAAGAATAQTGAPRSAIDWLSQSLRTPPATDEPVLVPATPPDAPRTVTPFTPGRIATTSLGDPIRNGVGAFPAGHYGLDANLWQGLSADRVRRLISATPISGVPALRRLYRDMLMAETEPPAGSGPGNAVLLARIDRLMAAGLLDDADALLAAIGLWDPELFRRAFDVGLLTGGADARCEQLRQSPGLAPRLPTRVFCLARLGDWSAAALTLNLGRQVGDITLAEEALLARFLDPQLFEDAPPPPIPQPLTTLTYVLREAVGLPRPNHPLPLAFLHLDATDDAPLRARIEARERLVRAGAMPAARLFEAYRTGKPAASGGVWDHAAAVQALDRAFAIGQVPPIAEALRHADELLSNAGLRHALARTYAVQIAALPPGQLGARDREEFAGLLLLAGRAKSALQMLPVNNRPSLRVLVALASGSDVYPADRGLSTLESAIARGMTAAESPSSGAALAEAYLARGQTGAALMTAVRLLAPGVEVDPGDLAAGLWILRQAGRPDLARQVAVETLLLLPRA